jgi:hypothetical protein
VDLVVACPRHGAMLLGVAIAPDAYPDSTSAAAGIGVHRQGAFAPWPVVVSHHSSSDQPRRRKNKSSNHAEHAPTTSAPLKAFSSVLTASLA